MNIRNVTKEEKVSITKALEAIIRKHKFPKVKTVISNYFKNSTERQKALARIDELKKEIASLEKKK